MDKTSIVYTPRISPPTPHFSVPKTSQFLPIKTAVSLSKKTSVPLSLSLSRKSKVTNVKRAVPDKTLVTANILYIHHTIYEHPLRYTHTLLLFPHLLAYTTTLHSLLLMAKCTRSPSSSHLAVGSIEYRPRHQRVRLHSQKYFPK